MRGIGQPEIARPTRARRLAYSPPRGLRITRGLLPGRGPTSCTDAASYRTDSTHRAGVLR
jgi:hypothetical protein